MTLVGVGHALADGFAFVGEDVPKTLGLHPGTFNRVPDFRMRAILATLRRQTLMSGGSAANTVKLAARLGLSAGFIGRCGHDEAGQVFEAELLAAGVRPQLRRSDDPTGLCITFLSPAQGRTVATFRSVSAGLSTDQVTPAALQAADVLVVEGYLLDEPEFFDDVVTRAQAAGATVALDLGEASLAERHRERLWTHLDAGRIGHLFLSEPDAASLTEGDAALALAKLGSVCRTVVIRRGDRGWMVGQGNKAHPVAPTGAAIVDPTGTTDAFEAGFLWGLAQGHDPVKAAQAGALVAGCVAEGPGTRVDDERWARLLETLRN